MPNMILDAKRIKTLVQAACSKDIGLARAIEVNLGWRPVWSRMNHIQVLAVWLACRVLTTDPFITDPTPYRDALESLRQLPEFSFQNQKPGRKEKVKE